MSEAKTYVFGENQCSGSLVSMCKADFYGSCIRDEHSMALFIKDTIDDKDASNETTFRRWVATMVGNGEPIEWDELC